MKEKSETKSAVLSRKWREMNKIASRSSVNNYQKKIRHKAIEALGGKCCQCGFSDIRALQIDHINSGGTKTRGRNNIGWARLYNSIINHKTDEYQLLCANCNFIKRHTKKEFNFAV